MCLYAACVQAVIEDLDDLTLDVPLQADSAVGEGQPIQGGRAWIETPPRCPSSGNGRRRAGVTRNLWFLPACQSVYLTENGPVVSQGTPLVSGIADVPPFDRDALVAALRTDQAGKSTFPEFLAATWRAGVVRYDVDFVAHTVSYHGCQGEEYIETYPAVEVP